MRNIWVSVMVGSALLASGAAAQPTAAEWAGQQRGALEQITDASLAKLCAEGAPAFARLFAAVKTDGATDALEAVRLAAVTQYVMRQPAASGLRKTYADALLAAAQKADAADVVCVFLDQLRWCGMPHQAAAVKAFEKSDKPGVAGLAAITLAAVTDDCASKAKPNATACAKLNAELAGLSAAARMPKLLQAFDGADSALAGVALTWARTTGGTAETAQWVAKLKETKSAGRRVMLIDMLADRGDKSALKALAPYATDEDNKVAGAALQAMFRLDAAAFARQQLPALLKALPDNRVALVRGTVRQMSAEDAAAALVGGYAGFSDAGKRVALEVCRERRLAAAAELALTAVESKNEDVAITGYRLLRDVGGVEHIDFIVTRMLATGGRVTQEAQGAVAAIARRGGFTVAGKALARALGAAPDAQKGMVLEAAGRVGGKDLLAAVEKAAQSGNADVSVAAVRALADWPDAAALPALMRFAVTGQDARRQTLAMRGVSKLLEKADAAVMDAAGVAWQDVSGLPGNDENRASITALVGKVRNVALGKKVTTNVPHEHNHVPENLTDGTLDKAWYGAKWPAQAVVDFGAVETVNAAHVTFYHADGRTYTYTLELSEDGKAWKPAGGNTDDPRPATASGFRLEFPKQKARYARLNVLKNSANPAMHVLELKVLAAE